jgi:hypothetical protein
MIRKMIFQMRVNKNQPMSLSDGKNTKFLTLDPIKLVNRKRRHQEDSSEV